MTICYVRKDRTAEGRDSGQKGRGRERGELEDTRIGEQEGARSIPGEMGDLGMSLVSIEVAEINDTCLHF